MSNQTQLTLFDEPETQAQGQKDRRKNSCLTHFAVIEPATVNFNAAVWGVGRNKKAALDDALTHLVVFEDNNHKFSSVAADIDDTEDFNIAIGNGKLVVLPCSKKLFKYVCTYGGDIEFIRKKNAAFMLEDEIN